MRLPRRLHAWILGRALTVIRMRAPDQVIGGRDRPYLKRWYLTPWSRYDRLARAKGLADRIARTLPNVYLHLFLRSDDDRALHDHPWPSMSILLVGGYLEHTIAAGGIHHHAKRWTGDISVRSARAAHRVELLPLGKDGAEAPCWTLFVTGFKVRAWGFHCPAGWRHWREFTAPGNPGVPGRGCE